MLEDQRWAAKIFSSGWQPGSGTLDVVEPATGAPLGRTGLADAADVAAASAAAAAAQPAWAAASILDRAAVLRRAAGILEQHLAEITEQLIRETGSVPGKAGFELGLALRTLLDAAGLPSLAQGEVLPTAGDRWSFARRIPIGVVGVISPFNSPIVLGLRSVAPALALGNAVLLKPDPRTPIAGGVILARLFEEAGLPEGLLHVLPGGAETGQAVVRAAEVQMISFTGSAATGRQVGELAAAQLKKTHLELGGKNSVLVLPGADLAKAASAAAFASFFHQGQVCMSAGRILVPEAQHDEFVELLCAAADRLTAGDPRLADSDLGPLIDARQLARIKSIVADSVADGARIRTGGETAGLFMQPLVLSGLRPEHRAWQAEIFGPVAPVMGYRDLDQAVDLVNATEYGLSTSILGDVGTAMRLADRIRSGIVHINEQTIDDEPNVPFGGTGASGNGTRFGGAAANLEAYTETQWLTVRSEIADYPF